MKLMTLLLAAALSFGYQNPVIPGFHPDPSVCCVDDDFYLVCSSFQYFPGVPIFHSKDLIHWEQIGNVLDRPDQLPLEGANAWGGIYAPTIRYHEGRYYMITTNVSGGGNFFVWADDPAGPWSDPVWLNQGGIDPSLFWEDGKCWMVSNPDNCIWLCQIDDQTGEQLTPSVPLWTGDGGRYPEAPHIYKKDGWYYLMIAEGGTEFGHSETIARSRSLFGPYESNPDNPILCNQRCITQNCEIQGTGHADLVQAPDGSWWMVCLAFRTQNGNHHLLGRETCLVPVEWEKGGWPVVNGTGSVFPDMQVPTLPQCLPDGSPLEDAAAQDPDRLAPRSFGPEWVWLNNPVMENYRFTDKGLEIVSSSVDLDADGVSPSFVALRQERKDAEPGTTVSIKGARKGDRAGLSVYMGDFAHCDIYVTRGGLFHDKVVVEYSGLGGLKHVIGAAKVRRGAVSLHVASSEEGYSFACTDSRGRFSDLGWLDCRYLSTETVNGFVGITFGLFAVNAPENPAFTAGFSEFLLD